MKKLSTIQKREKLNEIYQIDEIGPGGAYHKYAIIPTGEIEERLIAAYEPLCEIQLQKGARHEDGSIQGVIDTDLLEIARDRLKSFQAGPFSSRENACALTHIEEALMWLNRRVEERIDRNVLGKEVK